MDRADLADFLRRRREALKPADVGVSPGVRRRTPGLKRDEVALLAGMSTDYYTRLEQGRGPHPSSQILASLARALRLTDDERDHLYLLSGQAPPPRIGGDRHVGPGLMLLLDTLQDTPACVMSDLGEVLVQNEMYVALIGDRTHRRGLDRFFVWTWFSDPAVRESFPSEDWERMSSKHVADLRAVAAKRAGDVDVEQLVAELRSASKEFERLWTEHRVEHRTSSLKTFLHPVVGSLTLTCETLVTQKADQHLMIYYADPATDAREKLDLLRVVGTQAMRATVE